MINYGHNARKEHDAETEANIKINTKLDQICQNLTELRVDQRSLSNKVTDMDKELYRLKGDVETAFLRIDELRKEINHD